MKVDKSKWEVKKLGEVCELYQPRTISCKELIKDGKYPVYGANGIIGRYNQYNHVKSEILMTCRGATCGTINIAEPYSWINGNAMVIHPKNTANTIHPKYMVYGLKSLDYTTIISGMAQPQITRNSLEKVSIPVPPLPEQQVIASELDAIQSLITKYKELLNDYDNLAKSIFNEMFGDPQNFQSNNSITLGKACSLKAGKGIKASELIKENKGGLYPCYGGNGIRGYINKCSNNEDSPIIGRQGALCGNVNFAKGKFYATEHAVVVTPKIKLNKIWLYYILTYLNLNRFAHGVAQPGLSVKDLIDISIPLAELELQQKFAARIIAIESQKDKVKQQITDLQTLFDSRMQYYFD